jgi:putative glutamine amidotransferase
MHSGMRPVIGIPCYAAERAGNNRPLFGNNRSYVQAVLRAGGAPVLLPPVEDDAVLAAVRAPLDGLLLSGGGDVDPVHYGEAILPECDPPEPARDYTELALTRWALEERLPILGICRGMQMLNIALGGSLYQDLPSQCVGIVRHNNVPQVGSTIGHMLRVRPDSQLATVLGTVQLGVNSFHHQAVKRPGAGVEVVAWAEDEVAEAIEAADYPFVMAVQYHPEALDPADEPSRRLFAAFVDACRARRTQATASAPRRPRRRLTAANT